MVQSQHSTIAIKDPQILCFCGIRRINLRTNILNLTVQFCAFTFPISNLLMCFYWAKSKFLNAWRHFELNRNSVKVCKTHKTEFEIAKCACANRILPPSSVASWRCVVAIQRMGPTRAWRKWKSCKCTICDLLVCFSILQMQWCKWTHFMNQILHLKTHKRVWLVRMWDSRKKFRVGLLMSILHMLKQCLPIRNAFLTY